MSSMGQLTAVRLVSESAFGVPSGTVYKALRQTDNSLNAKKATYQSNEIRADRMTADLRHGLKSVAGDISIELGLVTFDDLIEAAVSGNWAAVTSGSQTMSSTTGTNTITRSAGSFVTDGFLPGDEVNITGFATGGNNGRTKLLTVTALSITVEKALATDASAAGRTVEMVGKRCKTGSLVKTFHIERAFQDVNQFMLFKGMAVDQLKISVKPEEIITAQFSLLGKEGTRAGVTASTGVTAAATNSPFDAFKGAIRENNAAIASISSLEINLSNGRAVKGVIGQQTPQEIMEGGQQVSGTATLYFADGVHLDKFLNETESSIDVRLDDPNGVDFHRIRIPRVKYTAGDLDNPKEGPVTVTLPFVGLYDSVSAAAIIYQRSNV